MSTGSLFSHENLIVGALSLVIVIIAVTLHHEVLNSLYHRLPTLGNRSRQRMWLLVLATFAVHTVEIWLFGGAYWLLFGPLDIGHMTTDTSPDLLDLIYFSAATYTTVGYGDVVVQGGARILAGTEALIGLVLITWSASFAYSELQRSWGR